LLSLFFSFVLRAEELFELVEELDDDELVDDPEDDLELLVDE